jgi:hypothetical protein
MRAHTQHAQRHPVSQSKPKSHIVEKLERKLREAASCTEWDEVRRIIEHEHFAGPHKLNYEFIEKCPKTFEGESVDLRGELMEAFAKTIDATPVENIDSRRNKVMGLIQAGSFHSPSEYHKQKTHVLLLYKALNRPVPVELHERMTKCEKIHRRGKSVTVADLILAGYEKISTNGRQVTLVHPQTGHSQTMYEEKVQTIKVSESGHKLVGGALLSREEQEERAKANKARNIAAKNARKSAPKVKKVKVVVADVDSKKGGKKGASSKKGGKGNKK